MKKELRKREKGIFSYYGKNRL